MSVSHPKYKPYSDANLFKNPKISNPKQENNDNDKLLLANLVDNVNNNNLNIFYPKEESLFKKKIDKLNLKFYLETEKYLSNQHNDGKTQDSLFIILFQQISIYIEEIERLNLILQQKKGDPNFIKERVDEYIRKQKDFEIKEKLIKTLKESKVNLEKKLSHLMLTEDQIKSENESLRRQNKFYQNQLQSYIQKENDKNITLQPSIEVDINTSIKLSKKLSKKRNFSENNPANINQSKVKNPNEINVFRGGNRYVSNNINNSTNGGNSVEHGLKLSSGKNVIKQRKELKIIKAVKEQLTRTASGDSNNISNQQPRCPSPPTVEEKENIKQAIDKLEQEINELNFLEIYLKNFKKTLINENASGSNNNNPLNMFGDNDNNTHMKTEVNISDLEDYSKGNKSNGYLNKKNSKNFSGNALNSITINLDSSENEVVPNKYGFHNPKIKPPHFMTINLTSSPKETISNIKQKKPLINKNI